jgi:hypothetical protein
MRAGFKRVSSIRQPALDPPPFAQNGARPERIKSKVRSPALASKRTIGNWSVAAAFQLGGKFGVGRCGGIEKTSLISLTSEERRARADMAASIKTHWAQAQASVAYLVENI